MTKYFNRVEINLVVRIAYKQWWILGEANEAATSGSPFLELSRDPPYKNGVLVLGYFVAF